MQVISRKGSLVTLRDRTGKLWLTRRVKRKKDARRQWKTSHSILHIPIERIVEKGDWMFTCSMQPLQFSHWEDDDRFITLNGSHHSQRHCSLAYAKFFIEHKLWELYEVNGKDWEKYPEAVKKVCEAYKIKYEGV